MQLRWAKEEGMGSRDAWTLFRVGGIPVRIHFTWIFVAAWVALAMGRQFGALARAADIRDEHVLLPVWVWAVLLTIAFFACVVLHELAHIALARRGGARVQSVTLMMLGGVSEIGQVDEPRLEGRMALAGPLSSFVLAALFYGLFRVSEALQGPPDVQFGLFYLAQWNVVIGAFNLLPAFPMDGGRILRSLLVRRFGRLRATQIAVTVGKVVAAGLVVAGLFGAGFWLALIGLFIFIGGDAEYRSLQAQAALRGLRVGDLFTRRIATVGADASVADAALALWRERAPVGLVTVGGQPAGAVSAAAIAKVPLHERAVRPVTTVMRPVPLVSPDQELTAALEQLQQEGGDAAAVTDHGRLLGTLSLDDIARGLQLRALSPAN